MAVLKTLAQFENLHRRSVDRPRAGLKTYSGTLVATTATLDFWTDFGEIPSGSGHIINDGADDITLRFNPDSRGYTDDVENSTDTYVLKNGEIWEWGSGSNTDIMLAELHLTVAGGQSADYRVLVTRG
jgi:hypothetical protein